MQSLMTAALYDSQLQLCLQGVLPGGFVYICTFALLPIFSFLLSLHLVFVLIMFYRFCLVLMHLSNCKLVSYDYAG